MEGTSAGGTAKQGRDRRFQAILPLRGKIINIEKTDDAKMYKNEEIQALITALGLGNQRYEPRGKPRLLFRPKGRGIDPQRLKEKSLIHPNSTTIASFSSLMLM